MEDQMFHIEGEDLDGDFIEFDFEGDIDSCILDCEKTLAFAGGGHLDIFLDDCFIQDVEV